MDKAQHTPGPYILLEHNVEYIEFAASREIALEKAKHADEATAGNVSPAIIPVAHCLAAEAMLRTLQTIADWNTAVSPGHAEYMSRAQVIAAAKDAIAKATNLP